MRRAKVKKENPPVRLLGTMFLLVLGLVVVYVVLALGIHFLPPAECPGQKPLREMPMKVFSADEGNFIGLREFGEVE